MTPAAIPHEKQAAVSKLESRALSICQQARELVITNDEESADASYLLNNIVGALMREADDLFDPMIEAAHRSHRMAIDTKKKALAGLPDAKDVIRKKLAAWAQQVEDIRREARLRAEQEAREADAARIEREVAAIEEAGEPDAALDVQAVLDAPRALTMPPAAVEPLPAPVPGARDVYTAEVTNLRQFFAGLADGRVPGSFVKIDQAALNRRATADREGFSLPGCKLLKTKSVVSTRRF